MKQLVLIGILLLTQSSFCQNFNMQDSVFEVNDKLITNKVVFHFNSGDSLFKESVSYLDSLAIFLLTNDSLNIEIRVHCDERVSPYSSFVITQRRARTINRYLVSKGISQNKITYKGFQDEQPIIKGAKTDEEHFLNRRTEFVITKIE